MTETPTDGETRRVDLPTDGLTHVEAALKDRMADVLPMAATEDGANHWEREYGSLARSLRRVLERDGQPRTCPVARNGLRIESTR